MGIFFFFKQKTAYEMRISDWSSDVCSSDLRIDRHAVAPELAGGQAQLCGFAIRRIGQRRDGTGLLLLHAGMLARERTKRGAWPDFKQNARTATVDQALPRRCEAPRCAQVARPVELGGASCRDRGGQCV